MIAGGVSTCNRSLSSPITAAVFQSMISEKGSSQPLLSITGTQAAWKTNHTHKHRQLTSITMQYGQKIISRRCEILLAKSISCNRQNACNRQKMEEGELDHCKLHIKWLGGRYDPCGVTTSSHTHWLMVFDVQLILKQLKNLDPIQRVLGPRVLGI